MKERLKLSVIIVNYNVKYFLEQALLSVEKAIDGLSADVYVVDNNSVDGSVEMVQRQFPWVKLIANKGFGDEYGIANPDSYSMNEVAQLISSNIGYVDENEANRQSSQVITEKTLDLGWTPEKSLHEYIKSELLAYL